MECDIHNFLSFWTSLCPFTPHSPPPPNNPEIQNFEKIEKIPEDIIILHKCTVNDNRMMHGS